MATISNVQSSIKLANYMLGRGKGYELSNWI